MQIQAVLTETSTGTVLLGILSIGLLVLAIDYARMLYLYTRMVGISSKMSDAY